MVSLECFTSTGALWFFPMSITLAPSCREFHLVVCCLMSESLRSFCSSLWMSLVFTSSFTITRVLQLLANDLPRSRVGDGQTKQDFAQGGVRIHGWCSFINESRSSHCALHLHVFTYYLSISKTCFLASLFPVFSEGCEGASERHCDSTCETCYIHSLVFTCKQLQQVPERLIPSELQRCFLVMCLFMCLLIVSILFLLQVWPFRVTNFILFILILTTLKHFH